AGVAAGGKGRRVGGGAVLVGKEKVGDAGQREVVDHRGGQDIRTEGGQEGVVHEGGAAVAKAGAAERAPGLPACAAAERVGVPFRGRGAEKGQPHWHHPVFIDSGASTCPGWMVTAGSKVQVNRGSTLLELLVETLFR